MTAHNLEISEPGLSVIVIEGGQRFVIDARSVVRLQPLLHDAGASKRCRDDAGDVNPEMPMMRLSELLELKDAGEASVVVTLEEPRPALMVEAVDAVIDLREARFATLPTLTRLMRPAFRGVYELQGELLPVLSLDGLLDGMRDGQS